MRLVMLVLDDAAAAAHPVIGSVYLLIELNRLFFGRLQSDFDFFP